MEDVLIVGAGPAGSVAATVLARAGVRVRLIDRATFPRDKLCGDTINPGTLALLRRLRLASEIEHRALRIDGMLVTGEGGVSIRGTYPDGRWGLAITRRELDMMLLQHALAAGAAFECGVPVRAAIVNEDGKAPVVEGVRVGANGSTRELRARVVIAADGRRSALAFGLHLSRHPDRPKRWAIGAYFEGGDTSPPLGEMHIRRGRYIGVAPVAGGLTNVCLVKPWSGAGCDFQVPHDLYRRELAADPVLRDRFAGREPIDPPAMLGPLAVDVRRHTYDGLILAGDAAGFIDPMTGDGLRFAVRGGELAAAAALDALQHGWAGVHRRLAEARQREFAPKWRFNRALRALIASPPAVRAATTAARFTPGVVRALIARAGDCDLI
jgi:flavin-dependent dehydrogenase